MSIDAQALRRHADRVSEESLLRREGRLRGLTTVERAAVELTARAVGQGVARCLLEGAAADANLEAVLAMVYPSFRTTAARG
jgi:hypothetical protein